MMPGAFIHQKFGREAFGRDPVGYDAARPAYPDWVFDFLRERCGLVSGTVTFEIGAGAGKATRRLPELGANPLVAIEPDERLAAFLRETVPDKALRVVTAPFDEAILQRAGFDLGLSPTAFHWLNEDFALAKVVKLLRPGGWWAMLWNVFAILIAPTPFTKQQKTCSTSP
jgi:SAM-dependent methyltransferase